MKKGLLLLSALTLFSCGGGDSQPITITYSGETIFNYTTKELSQTISLDMDRTLSSSESVDPNVYLDGKNTGLNAGVKHTTVTSKDKKINLNFTFDDGTILSGDPKSGGYCYVTYKVKILKDGYKELTSFTFPTLTFKWDY